MTAPFEDRDGWEMTAIALDGSVYIELNDPPEIRAKRCEKPSGLYIQPSYPVHLYETSDTASYQGSSTDWRQRS
jgi:RAT1-interacting protein